MIRKADTGDTSDTADETCSSASSDSSTTKKYVVTLDKSNAKLDFTHYLGVFFWIGWTFFFFAFMIVGPFLYLYATPVFTFLVGLMTISLLLPINRKMQPKVSHCTVQLHTLL